MRQRKLAIEIAKLTGHAEAVHLSEQNSRGGFDHRRGSTAQRIGEPHVGRLFAQADGVHQVCVGIKLHNKLRRPALASEARMHALLGEFAAAVRAEHDSADAWLALSVLHKRAFSSAHSLELSVARRLGGEPASGARGSKRPRADRPAAPTTEQAAGFSAHGLEKGCFDGQATSGSGQGYPLPPPRGGYE